MKLVEWKTKTGKIPKFRHHVWYDNAPSHWKRAADSLNVDNIAKGDGYGKACIQDTKWQGVVQRMVTVDAEGREINKGLQTVGFERGHWNKDGRVGGQGKVLTLEEMRTILRKDPDFQYCPTILENSFTGFRPVFCGGFSMSYLAKFWCTLAWIEQYWNDVKLYCRERCDYTMTGLKEHFPVALACACPPYRIRRFMQKALDHTQALDELGPDGNFSLIPSLRRKYKSHRRAELVRFGLASEDKRRERGSWGGVVHSRLVRSSAAEGSLGDGAIMEDSDEAIWSDSDEELESAFASSASSRADALVRMAASLAEETFESVDVDTPPFIDGARHQVAHGFPDEE
jgi:hypothetical protein